MSRNRLIAALAFASLSFAFSAGGSLSASAQGCGPWNNWCMPQCGDWNNWCQNECGPWNNWCLAQCGAWNNWCRGVCGPWNGWCSQQAYGPGGGWASGWGGPGWGGPGDYYRRGPGLCGDGYCRNYAHYDNEWHNDLKLLKNYRDHRDNHNDHGGNHN